MKYQFSYGLMLLLALMGLTVMIDPYDWIYLRALWGDQHAVRYEVAMAAVERSAGELWKWKSLLSLDPANDRYRALEQEMILKNIRDQ